MSSKIIIIYLFKFIWTDLLHLLKSDLRSNKARNNHNLPPRNLLNNHINIQCIYNKYIIHTI